MQFTPSGKRKTPAKQLIAFTRCLISTNAGTFNVACKLNGSNAITPCSLNGLLFQACLSITFSPVPQNSKITYGNQAQIFPTQPIKKGAARKCFAFTFYYIYSSGCATLSFSLHTRSLIPAINLTCTHV